MFCFHESQNMIFKYRAERIKQYKLVFPQLTTKEKHDNSSGEHLPKISNTNNTADESQLIRKRPVRKSRVGSSVAPVTMFQKMKGNTNPDLITQVGRLNYLFIVPH